jgi:hypothetical protein
LFAPDPAGERERKNAQCETREDIAQGHA